MDTLTIFVHYDGSQNEKNDYVDFKVAGFLLLVDCSYSNLLQMFSIELKMSISEENCSIQYLVKEGYKPMKINSNHSFCST